MLVSKEEFRSAMSHFATGVTVITTIDDEGDPHAMTANSFTSVCLDPPVVLVCVAHGTNTYRFMENTGRFGVNILGKEQQELGAYFARRPEDRKGEVDYSYISAEEGAPCLEHSLVFLACQVIGSHVYGDHTIFLGEVKRVQENDSTEPLLFYRSRWYNPTGD